MSDKLNIYNYANVVAFALSWALNSNFAEGPGREGWAIFSGMDELQRRYESIVNPIGYTYLIAHIILLLEGVFTVCQLLPKHRQTVLVQDCVKWWFLSSAVAQLFWSIALSFENVFAGFFGIIFMGIMFYSVTRILQSQAKASDKSQTPEEYWLLRFPFSVHFGWVFAVFVMSINGFFSEFGLWLQLIVGYISLAAFGAVAYKLLFKNGPSPNYVIPSTIAWVCVGIALGEKGRAGEVEGIFGFVFELIAGVLGAGLAGTTAFLFYKKEYKSNDLNNALNEDAGDHDGVYVNAPEGAIA